MTNNSCVEELKNRTEIVDLLVRFGRYLDDKNFDEYARCYTDDGVLILPWGAVRAQELAEFVRRDLGQFSRTHHLTTNHLVEISGDSARMVANLLAVHRHGTDPRAHWTVGAQYRCGCRRTARGWLFNRVELEVIWESGSR